MAWRFPERKLRSEINRLSRLSLEDLQLILDGFTSARRARIVELLREHGDGERVSPSPTILTGALSPWLEERASSPNVATTAATRKLLETCLADLTAPSVRPQARGSERLLDRGFALLAGTRRAR